MSRTFHVALMALILSGSAASATEEAEVSAGRSAIDRQIEAFRRDDGPAAYGLASPGIQGMFGDADAFMEMVRRSYRPVYRPRRFSFGPTRDSSDGFEQAVELQDEQGADWDAVYSFERQPDGTLKISGCRLVKRPGEGV